MDCTPVFSPLRHSVHNYGHVVTLDKRVVAKSGKVRSICKYNTNSHTKFQIFPPKIE